LGPNPGEKFDAILDRLYAWCSENEVPVMAHALPSNEAGPGYGMRADPKFWAKVLSKHPRLRLNMAHFGSFSATSPSGRLQDSWDWTMGGMFDSGNVFADLSYFSEILGDAAHRNATRSSFTAFRNTFHNSEDHLLYGTDWTMVGREEGFYLRQRYMQLVAQFLSECGYSDPAIEKIMFKNAVRYLGLTSDNKKQGTRMRLERFYADNGSDAGWMKVFD
jgi:predicted TIM-barrel fold metal-dependent hydrolase